MIQPAHSLQVEEKDGELPALLDAKALMGELNVTRAAAEALMRQLPVVVFDGLRKTYVKRSDVGALIAASTFEKDAVVS